MTLSPFTFVLITCVLAVSARPHDDLRRVFVLARQGDLPPVASYHNDTNLQVANWPQGLSNFDSSQQLPLVELGQLLKANYKHLLSAGHSVIRSGHNHNALDSGRLIISGVDKARNQSDQDADSDQQTTWQVRESNKHHFCAAGLVELKQTSASGRAAQLLAKHADLVQKIKTQGNIKDPNVIHFAVLSRILIQEQERGLQLPDWLDQNAQKEIRQLLREQLQMVLEQPQIRALLVGPIIQQLKDDLIKTTLDFDPNDVIKTVIYMVNGLEMDAFSLIMNATDLDAYRPGSALIFEQYANGSIIIKFIQDNQEHVVKSPSCQIRDPSTATDCDSIDLITKFNSLLSNDWKQQCSIKNVIKQSINGPNKQKALPYNEAKIKKLANLVYHMRELNQTLDISPILDQHPEVIELIDLINNHQNKSGRKQAEPEVDGPESDDLNSNARNSNAYSKDNEIKNILSQLLDEAVQKKQSSWKGKQQRKQQIKQVLNELIDEKMSDSYQDIVDEWTNRTSRASRTNRTAGGQEHDWKAVGQRIYDKNRQKKQKRMQLMHNLVEFLQIKHEEREEKRRNESAVKQQQLNKLIELIKNKRNKEPEAQTAPEDDRQVLDKLIEHRIRRPVEDHHEGRVKLASGLSVIEELDENDEDDEEDEEVDDGFEPVDVDVDSDADADVDAHPSGPDPDAKHVDTQTESGPKLNALQRLLIKAAEFRASKVKQIQNLSESIKSKMEDKKHKRSERIKFEQKVKEMLDQHADQERINRLKGNLMTKLQQSRDADDYVRQVYDYLDRSPSNDYLVTELRYKILGELLRYAKESEQRQSHQWSDLINTLVNRRRLRSSAQQQVNQLMNEITYTGETSVRPQKAIGSIGEHSTVSPVYDRLMATSPDATNDSQSNKSIWIGASVGLLVICVIVSIIAFAIKRRTNKRKQYVRM